MADVPVGGGLLVQAYYFWQYSFGNVSLYNRPGSTLLGNYSIFWDPIYSWLPILYKVDVAAKYLPNLAWLVALCALTGTGFIVLNRPSFPSARALGGLSACCFAVIFVCGSVFSAHGLK
jgi:hypothetical protein